MSQINWEKSFFLTAEEVATLGLEGISVNEVIDIREKYEALKELDATD